MNDWSPSADSQWIELAGSIRYDGKLVHPRGLPCLEILSSKTKIDMTRCITTFRPKLGYRFMAAEAWWILSGRNDVESIRPYSPHIDKFSNDGFVFDGAYGPKIVDQLRFVCDTLYEDPDSRQAVIEIWRPNPRPSADVPCTISVQWLVRPGPGGAPVLHCFDTMRSSDVWLGLPYDWFNFSMLSAYVALRLRTAGRLSYEASRKKLSQVQLGDLYITAASQHLYVEKSRTIPYDIAEVSHALRRYPNFQGVAYKPFNLDAFQKPIDLVQFLGMAKDLQISEGSWMSELLLRKELQTAE